MIVAKILLITLFAVAPFFHAFVQPEPTAEPTATSTTAPVATATSVPTATKTRTPTPTAVPKEDFSQCFFDSDKKADKVTRKRRKITVKFSKTKKTQTITLDKSYTYFRCRKYGKKTAIVAKKRWTNKKWTIIAYPSPLGINRVCSRIFGLGYRQLYKFSASGHLSGTDRAHSCSFIGGAGASVPGPNSLPLYDRNGNLLSSFRAYAKFGSVYSFRYYTYSPSCAQIAGTARSRTGSSEGYIGLGNGSCIKINNLYARQGGVY